MPEKATNIFPSLSSVFYRPSIGCAISALEFRHLELQGLVLKTTFVYVAMRLWIPFGLLSSWRCSFAIVLRPRPHGANPVLLLTLTSQDVVAKVAVACGCLSCLGHCPCRCSALSRVFARMLDSNQHHVNLWEENSSI